MKIVMVGLIVMLAGCATAAPKAPEKCMAQDWVRGTHMIVKVEGLDIHLVNIKTGEKLVISKPAHGWSEVECP